MKSRRFVMRSNRQTDRKRRPFGATGRPEQLTTLAASFTIGRLFFRHDYREGDLAWHRHSDHCMIESSFNG